MGFGVPQPQSPLRNGQDAYFTSDCRYPPNGPLLALDDQHYYRGVDHGMNNYVHRNTWHQVNHFQSWAHPIQEFNPHRTWTNDSTDMSCADSISTRPSEEPWIENYPRMKPGTSPYLESQAYYASPSPTHVSSVGGDCPVVIPSDCQQIPDAIAEPTEHLEMGETIEVHRAPVIVFAASPAIVENGLPTPTDDATSNAVGLDAGRRAEEETEPEDNSGDYSPVTRKSKAKKPKASSPKTTPLKSRSAKSHRVTKSISKSPSSTLISPSLSTKELTPTSCPHCTRSHANKSDLEHHIQSAHTRPFACIFNIYGCNATFGAKNEWKRHCNTQHLRLSFYRCDIGSCVPQNATLAQKLPGWEMPRASPSAPGFNDFNRKDLFIQHHRRMHAPAGAADDSQDKDKFKSMRERAARRCQVSARKPPPKTICGFCQAKGSPVLFEGPNAWETRMEHVGRHLESAKGGVVNDWEEDIDLRNWLVTEGLLQKTERGQWKLTDVIKAEEVKPGRR